MSMEAKQGRTYTREDIVRILDADIEKNVRQWGTDYIYTRWARENKEKILADYDAGMVVLVEKEWYCENGIEYKTEYYSDGSTRDLCYEYCD